VRLEGLGKLKNPMISSGIEPVTFRIVAQDLNQLRCRVPPKLKENFAKVLYGFIPSPNYSKCFYPSPKINEYNYY
jgi:hypothetical protein